MDAKLSIKFENGILEQTYKLKDNPLVTNVEEIKAWLDKDFYSEVDAHFAAMQQTAVNAFKRLHKSKQGDEFDVII